MNYENKNSFKYQVNTATGIAYATDNNGVVNTPYYAPDGNGEYYINNYGDYNKIANLDRYNYDATKGFTLDDKGDYVKVNKTVYVLESSLEKYSRKYNLTTYEYEYVKDANGGYYYNDNDHQYKYRSYVHYSLGPKGYSYNPQGAYVAITNEYIKISELEKFSNAPYEKDAAGNEIYKYAIDSKGFYEAEWKSEYVKQADGTDKKEWRMTDKKYIFAIDGANAYKTNSKGDIDYKESWDWKEVTRLGKNATSYKFAAQTSVDANKNVVNKTEYRIKAYKGTSQYGTPKTVTTTYNRGVVSKVNATKTDNGIKITWTPVAGAAYYKVYRAKTKSVVNNKDIGGIETIETIGDQVTNYVDVAAPVAVDVAAWNKAVDDDVARQKADRKAFDANTSPDKGTFDYSKYLKKSQKLNDKLSYYYQNYSYSTSVFSDADASAGILDYAGDLYSGNNNYNNMPSYQTTDDNGEPLAAPVWEYSYYPVVQASNVKESSLKPGVSYTYYVVAYFATKETVEDYRETNVDPKLDDSYWTTLKETISAYNKDVKGPQLKNSAYGKAANVINTNNYKDFTGKTVGVKTVGTATYTDTSAPKKPTLKSAKAAKGKVTISVKKKIAGADYYKVYRSTKKKGKYVSVGVTKNAKTLKLVDSSVIKGKTYYYKVVAVKRTRLTERLSLRLQQSRRLRLNNKIINMIVKVSNPIY